MVKRLQKLSKLSQQGESKMKQVFNVYSDPGHAWAKIPASVLQALGISDRITRCSYYRKGFAYLEEDCDLSLFISAFRDRYGISPKFREYVARQKSSKIRSYDNYTIERV